MALAVFLHVLLLAVVFCADTCGASVPPCKTNWFGSPCQYECHCVNNKCDENGECTETSACEKGWFGPSCQYVDLVATHITASAQAWVYDYPDVLCNTGQETVTVSLDGTFYFTWLRLRVNATVNSKDFTLQLKDAYGTAVECSNMYTSSVSDTLVDIHCQQGALFQKLTITGAGVRSLCSVYISGGRNVALGQNTTQSSDFQNKGSWLAVDGDSDSDFYHGSCTHTGITDITPTWKLTFERPHHVNRYVLYNRNANQERLSGFILEAVHENGIVTFNYTDSTNTSHSIYNIQSNNPQIPITGVNIVATHKSAGQYILTLCEAEMFGDTVCPAGYYGRDCNNRCNCATIGDNCFVSTGGCPSGCAVGYQGEGCQNPCIKKYFGVNCSQTCSTNCMDELCDATNGTCLSCIPGKHGPLCDTACSKKYFGVNCLQKCSTNCTDELCEATNGTCLSCIPGKQGSLCDEACSKKYFGVNCSQKCSTNCTNELCDATNGTCLSCIPGKQGPLCDKACSKNSFGVNCLQKCSTNCTEELCEATNGTCLSCIPGKQGSLCDEACSKKYFGVNCLHECSTNCTDELCEATNGTCLSCIPGKQGSLCDKALPVQRPEECISVAVIVGIVIAVVVVQDALIVIGVLIWRRLRHKMDETGQTTPHKAHYYSEAFGVRTLELNAVTTQPDKDENGQENSQENPYEIPIDSAAQTQKAQKLKPEDHVAYVNENPYEIPIDSAAQTQKAQKLKPEDHVAYVNGTMVTANDSFDDTMASMYVDINDI